jgi:hypothetical protein
MAVTCPHCSKPFDPERAGIQFCPNCGGQLEVTEASVGTGAPGPEPGGPTPGALAGPTGPSGPPWERRRELGFFKAFFETVKQSLISPQVFWSSVPADGPMSDSLFYAWLITALAAVLRLPSSWASRDQFLQLLARIQTQPNVPPEMQEVFTRVASTISQGWFGYVISGVIFFPLSLAVGAAFLHVCGLITGAGAGGYGATFRVVCYASAPQLLGFHWCLFILASFYQVALLILGLAAVHKTTTGKAAAAVLLPLLLCCACCCALMMLTGIAGAMSGRGH